MSERPETPNGDPASMSRVEKVNQLVRAFCVGLLLAGFVFAFAWGVIDNHKVSVSSDAFISVLTVALTWWFKSRDEQQRRADLANGTPTRRGHRQRRHPEKKARR